MKPYIRQNWPFLCWLTGLVFFFLGEGVSAFDRIKGNTASESFARLPSPARYAVVIGIGAVLGHWCWPLPHVDIDIDVEVKESK